MPTITLETRDACARGEQQALRDLYEQQMLAELDALA